jgi:hypothetical protein
LARKEQLRDTYATQDGEHSLMVVNCALMLIAGTDIH